MIPSILSMLVPVDGKPRIFFLDDQIARTALMVDSERDRDRSRSAAS